MTLTPVTSGDFAPSATSPGISIFMDRNNPGSQYNGPNGRPYPIFTSGTTNVTGTVYAPAAQVIITGGGSLSGGIVAGSFLISGGSGIIIGTP